MKNANTFFSLKSAGMTLVALFLMSAMSLNAQDKAVFTGKWALNESKSQLGEGMGRRGATKMVITQDAAVLTVERTSQGRDGQERVTTAKYNLDGTESDNSNQMRKSKSTAAWSADGQALTITSKNVFEGGGNTMESTSVEVYKLNADKCLVIENSMTSSMGDFKTTLVYDPAK